jgi:hypothetical protein
VNAQEQVVASPSQAAPAGSACKHVTVAQNYCVNAQGMPVNARGEVVASPAQAASASQGCKHVTPVQNVTPTQSYCVNAQGMPVNARGEVVASPSQAAPASKGCKHVTPAGVQGATKTLKPTPKIVVKPVHVTIAPKPAPKPPQH